MCLGLLCAPRTLACGHSFCGQCILSWTRAGYGVCPLCRAFIFAVPGEQGPGPNPALDLACRHLFRDEYDRRLQEFEDLTLVPARASTRSESLYPAPPCSRRLSVLRDFAPFIGGGSAQHLSCRARV